MTRCLLVLVALATLAPPAAAQRLRDRIGDLFVFGSGGDPLFLAGTADPNNPAAVRAHGDHFVPSAVDNNATLISFLTGAIGASVTNLPISATSGGRTFSFEGGVPVETSSSSGPIFAERARTLGRGRLLVGANVNQFAFTSLRGVSLDNIELNFTHVNADFPGCDTLFGGDCSQVGIPKLENDFIQLDLDLDLDVRSVMFLLSYGLFDRVDIGVAIPIVTTSLRGTSNAQVVPFGGPTAAHFFAGTPENPDLFASRFTEGSATGLGDVAGRIKVALSQGGSAQFAVLADARFATGSEADLLGSGETSIRGLGILSAEFGAFSPHANVGYLYRSGAQQNDAMLATVGFDQALAPWVTLAGELISELEVGDSRLTVPDPVQIEVPFRRTILPTNVPNRRDDIVDGAVGFKFLTPSGLTIITNALWPLNRGGLRPTVAWTAGIEYNF